MKNSIALIFIFQLSFFYSCDQINLNKSTTDATQTNSKKTLVLAIDGGGIKGIIPAHFLTLIEAELKKQTCELFDVIGGTSTGGIISIALTAPYKNGDPRSAKEVLDFYLNDCGKIFYASDESGPKYYADKKDILDSKQYGIEPYLKSVVSPTQTLAMAADSLANKKVKQVFTTTYIINSTGGIIANPQMGKDFGPFLFNWYDASQNNSTKDYFLWEAARATSAAPTYFPVANVGGGNNGRSNASEMWAIDGGLMSNDPAVWGITEALRAGIARSLDSIVVISLGCGLDKFNGGLNVTGEAVNSQPYGQKYGFWGDTDWATYLENLNGDDTPDLVIANVALFANQFVPASQLEQLATSSGLEYCRVQPSLPANLTPMDSCGNVVALDSFATRYFRSGEGKLMVDSVVNLIRANL